MVEDREELRRLISAVFEGAAGPYTIYLYGSRATGRARPDSDYDFALLGPAPLIREEMERLRGRLMDSLPGDSEVDLVDLRRVPLTLAAQILESGVILIGGDEGERARVETRLMSMYAGLNDERKEIIADIVERGSVYAG